MYTYNIIKLLSSVYLFIEMLVTLKNKSLKNLYLLIDTKVYNKKVIKKTISNEST